MPSGSLAHDATQLVSLANTGEARSLGRLAELAAGQVPGCSGAHASVWREGELVSATATHPDLAALAEAEGELGGGPLLAAVAGARDVHCPDTLAEERWPAWAAQALCRGVRTSAHLVRGPAAGSPPGVTLVLGLFGVRPGALDEGSVLVAEMLAGFGTAALANTLAYGVAQRTATELQDAVAARAVTGQAKGILMHALSCSDAEALDVMRRESQRRHLKVTEVAARVIEAYGAGQPVIGQPVIGAASGTAKGAAPSGPHPGER